MTYEVSEVALAGAIPEYFFLDDNVYEGSCKLSSVDGFGMLSFRELDAQREKLGVQVLVRLPRRASRSRTPRPRRSSARTR